jgi:hypothetical protein
MADETSEQQQTTNDRKRILLVDDDPEIVETMRTRPGMAPAEPADPHPRNHDHRQ